MRWLDLDLFSLADVDLFSISDRGEYVVLRVLVLFVVLLDVFVLFDALKDTVHLLL